MNTTAGGTPSVPKDISGLFPYAGETGTETSDTERSHYVASLTSGKAYQFEISGTTDPNLSIDIYDDDPTFWTSVCQSSASTVNTTFYCDVYPLYGSAVYTRQTSRDPYGGGYTINVVEIPFTPQGTDTVPVNIGSFPVPDVVGTTNLTYTGGEVDSTQSYYIADISGGYAYVNYVVTLMNQSADVDLHVYDDALYSNLLCSSITASKLDESCAGLSPAGNYLYIKVDGSASGFGGTFDLMLDHDYTPEGSPLTGNGGNTSGGAIMLTQGIAHQGQAGLSTASYYGVTGITPGISHTITVSQKFDSTCIFVKDETEGHFDTVSVTSDTNKSLNDSVLNVTPATTGIFVKVNGCGSTATGTAYTITID